MPLLRAQISPPLHLFPSIFPFPQPYFPFSLLTSPSLKILHSLRPSFISYHFSSSHPYTHQFSLFYFPSLPPLILLALPSFPTPTSIPLSIYSLLSYHIPILTAAALTWTPFTPHHLPLTLLQPSPASPHYTSSPYPNFTPTSLISTSISYTYFHSLNPTFSPLLSLPNPYIFCIHIDLLSPPITSPFSTDIPFNFIFLTFPVIFPFYFPFRYSLPILPFPPSL